MRYLNLNNRELKELLYTRREHLVIYILTLLMISVSSYILLQLILKTFVTSLLVIVLAVSYTAYVLYNNRHYLKELVCKKKKVYRGVLSFKLVSRRNKKRKYLFNVDGRIFYVDRKNFEGIFEGDVVEFHVSSSTKHLYKVEKVA